MDQFLQQGDQDVVLLGGEAFDGVGFKESQVEGAGHVKPGQVRGAPYKFFRSSSVSTKDSP